ncbi:hypothetical protein R1flu_022556 [Riccia fluitans]|uniref:Uncharacterized protein n=1 Tax=Riccia fluitans TaxID=41844 RepID=A0ABD1XPK5_9MARC
MQRERRTWFEREEELRGRIDSLETQCSRTSDMLSETTTALKVEKERRTDSRRELERLTEEPVTEKKLHRETAEKLNSYVTYFAKLEKVLATVKSAAKDRDLMSLESLESIINDMNIEFHFNFTHSSEKTMQSDSEYRSSELHRIIMQRDAADAERDMIEQRLTTILRETREGHGEMEALWLEREELLEQKIGSLDAELHHLHCRSKRKETEVMIERRRWADELEKSKEAWSREKNVWKAKLISRAGGHDWWQRLWTASAHQNEQEKKTNAKYKYKTNTNTKGKQIQQNTSQLKFKLHLNLTTLTKSSGVLHLYKT